VSYSAGPPRCAAGQRWQKSFPSGRGKSLLPRRAKRGKYPLVARLQKDFGVKKPLWGFAGHPLLDGKRADMLAAGEGTTAVGLGQGHRQRNLAPLSAKEPRLQLAHDLRKPAETSAHLLHPESVNSLDPERAESLVGTVQRPLRHDGLPPQRQIV